MSSTLEMKDQSVHSTALLPREDYSDLKSDDQATQNLESAIPGSSHSSNVPTTLPLLYGKMTLAEALDNDENMLFPLAYSGQREDFLYWIYQHREDYLSLVSLHLGLPNNGTWRFGEFKEWKHGSFNVCIPIYIHNWKDHPRKRVLLRLPLPYKVGESKYPGNADEKLRGEVAAFIWIQENCPDIPIPFLWGFGFPGGQSFIKPENTTWSRRTIWYLRRAISFFFGSALSCRYIKHNRQSVLDHGYLIMDYIEPVEAELLLESWDELRHDDQLRTTFFKDLSRIMLSLSQIPLPRIGSWTINELGVLVLANRPLAHHFHSLENEGIPTNIPRSLTYMSTDPYYNDLLACHDSRIRSQPNAILNERDGIAQMANLFTMRGLLSHFTSRDLRHGPFIFNLTDLHRGNIFVDSKGHIKYVIDLEWACSLPVEMLAPPHWITNRGVDELIGGELQTFETRCQEFMDIFEEEEKSFPPVYGSTAYRTDVMRKGWTFGSFWFFHALKSPKGLCRIFDQHIQPVFDVRRDMFEHIVSPYWGPGAQDVIAAKLEDNEKYEQQLRQLFRKSNNPNQV